MNRGLIYGLGAYTLWGLLPVYWKMLQHVSAAEILAHRVIWSLVFLALLLSLRRQWQWLRETLHDRRTLLSLAAAAVLLSINWFTYIWGVNNGYVVEASLGYFITPLVNVVMGVFILREYVRPWQWLAVGLAAVGVLYLAFGYGSLPWIALTLAFSFGTYGLLKKQVRLNSIESLSAEMMFMFLPALAYFSWLSLSGAAAFGHSPWRTQVLLLGAGAITATPLLLFGAAARRIPLSALGLLQYIAPSLQFLLGVLVYHEPFTADRLIGFTLIWLALAVYTFEGIHRRRSHPSPKLSPSPSHYEASSQR